MKASSPPEKSGSTNSDSSQSGQKGVLTFEKLYIEESRRLGDKVDGAKICPGVEPWISFTPRDRFGLALSGGGIRTATFNLGLLQAFAHLGVLKHVHYLSTVSGGGYIGGFWIAWLKRKGAAAGLERFPLPSDQTGEPAEVRHLREFSRFLLPRVGVLETEFWAIIMTVLGGLIPSFLTAVAVLFLAWSVWLALTGVILNAHPKDAIGLGIALALYLIISQWMWIKKRKSEPNKLAFVGYVFGCLFASLLMLAEAWFWPEISPWLHENSHIAWHGIPREFFPALLLGAGTLILLFVRVALAPGFRDPKRVVLLEGFERTLTRFLGATAALLFLAALWWISGELIAAANSTVATVTATATGAIGSAALFAWAKKWLLSPVEKTHASSLSRTAINHLKRATPKALAWLAFLSLFLSVGACIHALHIKPDDFLTIKFAWLVAVPGGIVFLALLLFDPARVGMHEFYRTKISRCYLGASNSDPPCAKKQHSGWLHRVTQKVLMFAKRCWVRLRWGKSNRPIIEDGDDHDLARSNRQIIERRSDDLQLKDLGDVGKPIHLICTAANDISGDPLGTLYRGAPYYQRTASASAMKLQRWTSCVSQQR